MKTKIEMSLITSTLISLLPIVLGLALYDRLPSQIAIHWDSAGTPDNFASKPFVVWGLPMIMAAIHIFITIMIQNDPKKANASAALKKLSGWLMPIMSIIFIPVTLFKAIGYNIPIEMIAPVLVGVIVTVCGNYFPKSKQNYTIGIKLPWTLQSTDNWNKTHRLAGYLWSIGGIVLIITGFLNLNWIPFLLIVSVLTLVPILYSYSPYKKGI